MKLTVDPRRPSTSHLSPRSLAVIGLWIVLAVVLVWLIATGKGASGFWAMIGLAVLLVVTGRNMRKPGSTSTRAAGSGLIIAAVVLVLLYVAAIVLVLATWRGP